MHAHTRTQKKKITNSLLLERKQQISMKSIRDVYVFAVCLYTR